MTVENTQIRPVSVASLWSGLIGEINLSSQPRSESPEEWLELGMSS